MAGEPAFFEIGVGDTERGRAFYEGLFGWRFEPGPTGHGFAIGTPGLSGGMHGGDAGAAPYLFFRVDDMDAALERVRELGGTVDDTELDRDEGAVARFGRFTLCRDDQGSTFGLHEPPAAASSIGRMERAASSIERMERDELRALQAPLKERYATEPEAALITLAATGTLGEGVSCSVETGRALAMAGLHPATGGDGSLLCSGDMLLEALVACAGVTLGAVATSLGIDVRSGRVRAEGDLDFRGTLAVGREAPVGFSAIRLEFDLDTDADAEQLATLCRLTERYCVVYQSLARPPALSAAVTAPATT